MKEGYEEITVTISKTIQEEQYEPLRMEVTVHKEVKSFNAPEAISITAEMIEKEIANFLDTE